MLEVDYKESFKFYKNNKAVEKIKLYTLNSQTNAYNQQSHNML